MFSDVRVTRAGLADRRQRRARTRLINRVAFEGNRKVERATLEPELQTKARGAYNAGGGRRRRAAHPRHLPAHRPRPREVTPRVVDLPNGRIDVVFTINEGDKTGIKEINFVGNSAYSISRLRDLMTTTEIEPPQLPQELRTSTIPTGSPPTRS